jgi:hypothetical protein
MITTSTFTAAVAETSAKELRRKAARRRAIDGMQHELDRLIAKRRCTRLARLIAVATALGL